MNFSHAQTALPQNILVRGSPPSPHRQKVDSCTRPRQAGRHFPSRISIRGSSCEPRYRDAVVCWLIWGVTDIGSFFSISNSLLFFFFILSFFSFEGLSRGLMSAKVAHIHSSQSKTGITIQMNIRWCASNDIRARSFWLSHSFSPHSTNSRSEATSKARHDLTHGWYYIFTLRIVIGKLNLTPIRGTKIIKSQEVL